MVKLVENLINHVSYDKNEDYSEREIIPLNIPDKNVFALDVSGFKEPDKVALLDAIKEYKKYMDRHNETMFDFEDWAHQSAPELNVKLKYRKFNLERLKNI